VEACGRNADPTVRGFKGDRLHLRGAAAPPLPLHQSWRIRGWHARAAHVVDAKAGRWLQPTGAAARVRATAAATTRDGVAAERPAAAGVGRMEDDGFRRRRRRCKRNTNIFYVAIWLRARHIFITNARIADVHFVVLVAGWEKKLVLQVTVLRPALDQDVSSAGQEGQGECLMQEWRPDRSLLM
jgi:hypothetical protein